MFYPAAALLLVDGAKWMGDGTITLLMSAQ